MRLTKDSILSQWSKQQKYYNCEETCVTCRPHSQSGSGESGILPMHTRTMCTALNAIRDSRRRIGQYGKMAVCRETSVRIAVQT